MMPSKKLRVFNWCLILTFHIVAVSYVICNGTKTFLIKGCSSYRSKRAGTVAFVPCATGLRCRSEEDRRTVLTGYFCRVLPRTRCCCWSWPLLVEVLQTPQGSLYHFVGRLK